MGLGDTQPDPPGKLRVDVLRDEGGAGSPIRPDEPFLGESCVPAKTPDNWRSSATFAPSLRGRCRCRADNMCHRVTSVEGAKYPSEAF
jgi:hypothetical protein